METEVTLGLKRLWDKEIKRRDSKRGLYFPVTDIFIDQESFDRLLHATFSVLRTIDKNV